MRAQWHEAADGRRRGGWLHHTEAVQHGAEGSSAHRVPGTSQVGMVVSWAFCVAVCCWAARQKKRKTRFRPDEKLFLRHEIKTLVPRIDFI